MGGSELGRGDSEDIYPGLYTQSAVDDLEQLARQPGDEIRLSDFLIEDLELTTRVAIETGTNGANHMGEFADGHRDLLERQRHILLQALVTAEEAGD